MATVDRTESKRSAKRPAPRRKAKSHAFRNGCLVMVALLIATVYFAPLIIAKTPLRDWLLQTAVSPDGTITLGSASLGWFSPVAAEKLEVRDTKGDVVVAVESFRTEKSLISLLLDVDDLGRLHVDRPSIHVVAHEKDTNLERIFATFLNSEGESNVTAAVEVSEGTLVIDDAVDKRQFKIEKLAADCTLGDAAEGAALAASGALSGGPQPASFKIDVRATPAAKTQAPLANGKIHCQTSSLPLELLQPVLRRTVDKARLSGQLSTQLDGAWGDMAGDSKASLNGQAQLTQLAFGAAALGPDEIRLERVAMPCRIKQKGEMVEIEELAIDCDLGRIALTGSAKVSDFSAADTLSALARENYDLKGHIDLAKLASMLPDTLLIREGTEITAGQVDLVATARQQQSGMSWTGLVETKRLAAKAGGRPFAWENPLSLQFATHESADGIVIDRAVCTSSFLKVSGAGSLDNLSASADFDLARLVAELRQFSDLNNVQLAGQGRARLALKRADKDQFTADGDFQARGFQWITQNSRPWKEDNLVAHVSLNGQLKGQSLARVEKASLSVESGSDHIEARLREAIADPATANWPIALSWRGQLAPWAPRLESCLGLTGWDLGGAGTISSNINGSSKAISIDGAKIDVAQLHVQGSGWFIDEPAVSATLSARWDIAGGQAELTSAKVAAGTAVAVVDHALLRNAETKWALDGGTAHVEGDLAQLARWRQDPRLPAAWQVSGKLAADAQLKHADSATTGQVDAAIEGLQIVDAARPAKAGAKPAAWQERRITLAAHGNYQHLGEKLQLDKLDVVSDALRLGASGTLATGDQGGSVDIKGNVGYDWEQLAPLWKPYLGKGFRIAGKQTKQFAVHGQLSGPPSAVDSWKNVTGEAALGWTGMNAYGLRVGQGDIAAQLTDGQMRTRPIDVEISEGRLTFTPVARLSPAPAEFVVPSGPLLTNVRLSPELCAEGMRFVTPILANATVAEGRFSISLDGGRVPLGDPAAADFSGRMAMKGQVKPGPIAAEFVGIIKELTTLLQRGTVPDLKSLDTSLMSIDSPNIEFRMVNRRVYHRGLIIVVGTTPITTQGSVGMDETLSLVADVPINARLLGADLSLGALEGKTLKIPIEGTLDKPKLDRRALQDIPRQLIENTARGVLTDSLNKGLERLFPGQK